MIGDAEKIVRAIRDEQVTQIYFSVDVDGIAWSVSIDLLRNENMVIIREHTGCYLIGMLGITDARMGRVYIAVEGRTGTYGVIFEEDDVMNLTIRGHDP